MLSWTRIEWKAVCATFRVFGHQIGSRSLQYVDVNGIAAASGVSKTTVRRVLNRLVSLSVLVRVGQGSVMYQPRFRRGHR